MRVNIEGELKCPCTAKDLTLKVLSVLGSKGALGRAIEYYGDVVESLDLAGRITLASMTTEMGGIISFVPLNDEVLDFIRERTGRSDIDPVKADTDARYIEEITIDISDLEPLIACPPNPANVKRVREVVGTPVDSIFVGSCTNGRFEDIRLVAEVLSGKSVAGGVMFRLVPATKEVFGQMLDTGMLEVLYNAGVIVSNPGCAGCAEGQIGMTGNGEVQLSTGNRNFPGKQGAGDTYLTSPLVCAVSALSGKITLP